MTPPPANPLGKTSLALGIASIAFVFGLGLCGLIGGARLPGVAQMQSSFALRTVFNTTALPV